MGMHLGPDVGGLNGATVKFTEVRADDTTLLVVELARFPCFDFFQLFFLNSALGGLEGCACFPGGVITSADGRSFGILLGLEDLVIVSWVWWWWWWVVVGVYCIGRRSGKQPHPQPLSPRSIVSAIDGSFINILFFRVLDMEHISAFFLLLYI
jgi:hypothetical protein